MTAAVDSMVRLLRGEKLIAFLGRFQGLLELKDNVDGVDVAARPCSAVGYGWHISQAMEPR